MAEFAAGRERSSQEYLFILLQWLAHKQPFHSIAAQWGGNEPEISGIVNSLVSPLSTLLYDTHVKWLTREEMERDLDAVMGLKGAIAIVDAVRLRVPKGPLKEFSDLFYSTDKKIHCVKAILWCGWNGRIIDVHIDLDGTRGRLSEITMVRGSPLLSDGNVDIKFPTIGDVDTFGLGDKAYRGVHSPMIITPYAANSPDYDADFNRLVSHTRIVVENVFGRVLGWWRRFHDCPWTLHNLELLPPAFKLACALTERLFNVRDGYPRSEDWKDGQEAEWERMDEVRAFVDGDMERFDWNVFIQPEGIDEDVEDEIV